MAILICKCGSWLKAPDPDECGVGRCPSCGRVIGSDGEIRDAAPDATASLGRSTAECVANGTWLGLAGGLDRWMTAVESKLANIAWLATGGDWPRLQPFIGRTVRHDPDLVLRGLARVLARSVLG